MRFFQNFDIVISATTLILVCFSLIILSSINPSYFENQLFFAVIGVVLYILVSMLDIRSFHRLGLPFYIISVILLISLYVIGIQVRGAQRWVEIFSVRLQFSELIKPLLIISLASVLSSWGGKVRFLRLLGNIGLFAIVDILILRQPDLGNAVVYAMTYVFMLFAAGVNIWYFVFGGIFFIISLPVVWHFLADYQQHRIIAFINPNNDPLGIGYNTIQSTIAVGSGLLFGRGLGRGVQSQLQFLPEYHTDFIFASLSEEFGFVGTLVVLALYFFLLFRILQISGESENSFESFMALGVFGFLLIQTFTNIGMNIGMVPVTGVTLPLLSYGGSSLVSTMVLLGLVNVISRNSRKNREILEIR